MPDQTDSLILSISADVRSLQRSLNTAQGITKKAAKGMEDSFSQAGQGMGKSMAAAQQASKNLSFQLNDITASLLGGGSPFTVMVQQGSQVSQAFADIRKSTGSLKASLSQVAGSFLSMVSGPALVANALIYAAGMATQYFMTTKKGAEETNKFLKEQQDLILSLAADLEGAVPGLQELADKIKAMREAEKTGQAADFVADDAYAAANEAAGKLLDTLDKLGVEYDNQSTAGTNLVDTLVKLQEAGAKLAEAQAKHEDTADEYKAVMDLIADISRNKLIPSLGDARDAVNSLGEAYTEAAAKAKAAYDSMGTAGVAAAAAAGPFGPGQLPPIYTAGGNYLDPAQAQSHDAEQQKSKYQTEQDKLDKEAAAAAKKGADRAADEAKRKAEEAAEKLTAAIANQSAVAVNAAAAYIGKSETANRGEINSFLKAGGVDLDAATTAWCAAFINSALAQVGIKGSGSQVATSFGGWGKAVDLKDIQPGDVGVQMKGHGIGEAGGHVGFLTGEIKTLGDTIVQVELLAGNSADKVEKYWVDASSVIARRAGEAFAVPVGSLEHLTEKNKKTTEKITSDWQQVMNLTQSAVSGFISDIRKGTDAGEAFANMLTKIVDGLIDMSLQMAFGPKGLGSLFTGGGAVTGGVAVPVGHRGGIVGQFGGDGRSFSPALWANAKRMHSGGIVGLKAGEIPIIAQRGELLVPRRMVGKGGGPAIKTGDKISNSINVDMGSGAVVADQERGREFGVNISRMIRAEMVKESRPGGLLRGRA